MRIEDCRKEIDRIDLKLLRLVSERAEISKKIGELKAQAGLPVTDKGREEIIISRAGRNKMVENKSTVTRIYQSIIEESRRIQTKVVNESKLKRSKI